MVIRDLDLHTYCDHPANLFFLQVSHKIENNMFSKIRCCVTCLLDFLQGGVTVNQIRVS